MTWFKKRPLEKKASKTAGAIVFLLSNPVWPTRDYVGLAQEGYCRNPWVYGCVNEIAKAVASIKWLLFEKSGVDGDRKEIVSHPLLKLLARPNPKQGGHSFIQAAMSYLLISGNAYIERIGPEGGSPQELYALRPDRTKVLSGDSKIPVAGYEYKVSGREVRFTAEEILHLKLFNPLDDFYGMSPIEVAALAVDANTEASKWNYALLKNMGRPSGALSTAGDLQPDQKEFLREQFAEVHQGPENAGRPILLEGGLLWQAFSLSPHDADWKEGKIVSVREICVAYNVPPELVGDPSNKTFSNYQEARKAFYQETVLPYMDFLRDEFNNWLVPSFGEGLELDYDKDAIEALREDRAVAWDRADRGIKAGYLKPNEARDMLGYDSVGPEGDKLYIPSNMMPLDVLSGDNFSGGQ